MSPVHEKPSVEVISLTLKSFPRLSFGNILSRAFALIHNCFERDPEECMKL